MSQHARKPTVTVRTAKAPKPGCLRAFFAVFFFVGAILFYATTVRPVLEGLAAQKWEATPCVITWSGVDIHPSSDRGRPTYSVGIVYRYSFHGVDYTSSRYQFSTSSTGNRSGRQRIVDQYPRGTHTSCYVNPAAPAEAVISRGLGSELAFGIPGLFFMLLGGAGVYFARTISGTAPQPHVVPKPVLVTGEPVPLKAQITPLGKFLLTLFFALFWNGIVGFFVYGVFFAHSHSGIPFFIQVFVGLFAVIGLLILTAAVGGFAALFNPRVHLTARTNAAPLGGVFQFQWTVKGRAERVHKIRIVLEGREEAVYASGDHSGTARQVFAEIPVFETTEREMIAQGQGRVTIPAGLMHTFHGRGNKVTWILRVHGEIPHWPAIDEDFPIIVLPQGGAT